MPYIVKSKRYLSFSGFDYDPNGGFNDFIGAFDTEEEAKNAVISHMKLYGVEETFGHIVDLDTGERLDAPEWLLFDEDEK